MTMSSDWLKTSAGLVSLGILALVCFVAAGLCYHLTNVRKQVTRLRLQPLRNLQRSILGNHSLGGAAILLQRHIPSSLRRRCGRTLEPLGASRVKSPFQRSSSDLRHKHSPVSKSGGYMCTVRSHCTDLCGT